MARDRTEAIRCVKSIKEITNLLVLVGVFDRVLNHLAQIGLDLRQATNVVPCDRRDLVKMRAVDLYKLERYLNDRLTERARAALAESIAEVVHSNSHAVQDLSE